MLREELTVFHNVDLSRYTTLKTGGVGERVFIPKNREELSLMLKQTSKHLPITLLGLGSNALVPDLGIKGLVVILQGSGLNQLVLLDNQHSVYAEAGVACGQFARFAARLGLTNMEFMAGIPGTIGGALAMNAGCYGTETWDLVTHVVTVNRSGQFTRRNKSEYDVTYRSVSLLKETEKEYFVAAEFDLIYGDKKKSLSNIKQLLAKRNLSQPTNYPNCGSVFRNPKGDYSARLIEACGLKGTRIGNAQISEKHANFIVNLGGAKTQDVFALIDLMQVEVKNKFNITLEREVKYL